MGSAHFRIADVSPAPEREARKLNYCELDLGDLAADNDEIWKTERENSRAALIAGGTPAIRLAVLN